MRKIGILGGTFNPIHIGHLMLSEWAMDAAGLDEIWMIPAGQPYKKAEETILPGQERLHMVELAVLGNKRISCLDLEIKRKGYTYTYETLEELKSRFSDAEYYFILGADCLFSLENWREPEKILKSCTLIAAVRNDISMEKMEKKRNELMLRFGGNIMLLPFVRMSISSSEIRQRVAEGKSIRYMVPDTVYDYIEEKGFYRG